MQLYKDFFFNNEADATGDTQPIEIYTGKFKGVVFKFKSLMVQECKQEMDEDDYAVIHFEYDLIKTGTFTKSALDGDAGFQSTMGEILHAILETTTEGTDEDRKDNPEEPTEK